jgi:hypothetical protein
VTCPNGLICVAGICVATGGGGGCGPCDGICVAGICVAAGGGCANCPGVCVAGVCVGGGL